jgi:pimeloyl-ACP methyl ester carboxylesterase
VVTYDRRGHSASPWSFAVTRRQDEDDLARLIKEIGSPVHLVGNSYGASISLGMASRRPELVCSVAVHEPPLLGVARPGTALQSAFHHVLAQVELAVTDIRHGRAEAGARRFVEEVALGPGTWSMLPAEVRATMVDNAWTFTGMLQDPRWDAVPSGPPASVPVLLTDGSTSPAWLRMIVDELAAGPLAHASRHTFAGAGHVPHSTHPAELAATIRRFVAVTTIGAAS